MVAPTASFHHGIDASIRSSPAQMDAFAISRAAAPLDGVPRTALAAMLGPGYVPARLPLAGPEGGPPNDAPHTTSVPFDCNTCDAVPSGNRTSAGVALPTSRSPRAS